MSVLEEKLHCTLEQDSFTEQIMTKYLSKSKRGQHSALKKMTPCAAQWQKISTAGQLWHTDAITHTKHQDALCWFKKKNAATHNAIITKVAKKKKCMSFYQILIRSHLIAETKEAKYSAISTQEWTEWQRYKTSIYYKS